MVLVLIQSSKLFKYYPGVGCLHSTLSIWDLGPLTLSGDRGRPDGEYPWPHSPRAPSCRCCLVGASTGSGVLIGPNVTVSITHPRIWPYILWSYRVDSYNWHYWTIRFYVGRPVLVPPHPTHIPTHIPTQLGFALHDE